MTFRFPSLVPGAIDPLWFTVDRPCDDENELEQLEKGHDLWLESIAKKDNNIVPVGKTASEEWGKNDGAQFFGIHFNFEHLEDDDEDEDDDEGDDDDESDTNDDELDTDMLDERDSGDDAG